MSRKGVPQPDIDDKDKQLPPFSDENRHTIGKSSEAALPQQNNTPALWFLNGHTQLNELFLECLLEQAQDRFHPGKQIAVHSGDSITDNQARLVLLWH